VHRARRSDTRRVWRGYQPPKITQPCPHTGHDAGRGNSTTGDPKDDYLVALYRSCQADLLVSGDYDLLDLAADDVTVHTPGELMEGLQP